MPYQLEENLKPTFVAQPDMRFATTFLSTKYRSYGVKGESLMDKESGEIFVKRPSDGKVVSFYQNKKYIHDLALELRCLLTNNENFTYPEESEEAYFLSTNYDLMTVNKEKIYNIKKENVTISDDENIDKLYRIEFKVSKDCNGFFTRVNTRDCDKGLVEFLTNQYNMYFENYAGDDEILLDEWRKFRELKWKDSNAILVFKLVVTKGATTKTYDSINDYIRLNEEVYVPFPMDNINEDFPTGYDTFTVHVKKINFYKIQFMLKNNETFTNFDTKKFSDGIELFQHSDEEIQVQGMNVMHFIDSAFDFKVLGNETIVGICDMPYIIRHMSKLAKLKNSSQFILAVNRPSYTDWSINTIWAEEIREVHEAGEETIHKTENTFEEVQKYLGKHDAIVGELTTDPTRTRDYLLIEV